MPQPGCLLLIQLLVLPGTAAWVQMTSTRPVAQRIIFSRTAPTAVSMLAKKKPKPRKPKQAASPFSAPAAAPRPASDDAASSRSSPPSTAFEAPAAPTGSLDDRLDAALKQAGITGTDASMPASSADSASPLSKIPAKGQELLERFFGGGALVFGSAFLFSGIAVSVEALCKVLDVKLPTAVDEAIVQFIEPALTPSILILFGFSISLGVLKQVCTCPLRPLSRRVCVV